MSQTVVIYDSVNEETVGMGVGYVSRLGALGIPVKGIRDLKYQLDSLRFQGVAFSQLIFVCHGWPGAALFDNTTFNASEILQSFAGQGFEDLFLPDAQVMFDGCQVARTEPGCETGPCSASSNGTVFLTTFAKTFLFKGGGRVGGWTSNGWGFGSIGGTHIHHWSGQLLWAFISRGGLRVRLAVGESELASPQGIWKVHGYGEPRYYWFEQDGVRWQTQYVLYSTSDTRDFGIWQLQDDWLYIEWPNAHAREWWDRPLFNEYQTAMASAEDGAYDLWAEKFEIWDHGSPR